MLLRKVSAAEIYVPFSKFLFLGIDVCPQENKKTWHILPLAIPRPMPFLRIDGI